MKVLSQEEKDSIKQAKSRAKSTRIRHEIEASDLVVKRTDRVVLVSLLFLLVVLTGMLAWVFLSRKAETRNRYKPSTFAAFETLRERARNIENQNAEALEKLDLERLRNYALIEQMKDISPLQTKIEQARSAIELSRMQTKSVFGNIYTMFPPDSGNERLDAQRLYGQVMETLDAREEQLENAEYVLLLLSNNQGKWHAQKNTAIFSEPSLQQEFDFYSQETDGTTARWRKDFKGIESEPVSIITDQTDK